MQVKSHTTLVIGKPSEPQYVEPGTVVELDKEEAADLIKRGIVTEVVKDEAKPAEKETPPKEKAGGNPKAGNPQ